MAKYEVGDRFESRDSRDAGKVVEIDEVLIPLGEPETYLRNGVETPINRIRYRIRSEVNPRNPNAVGRHTHVSENTLDTRYRKISH